MLKIVIAGAGEVGRYIASTLSKENHDIVLIDPDGKKLEKISWNTDIAIRQGSATNWQLLDELREFSPDLFLALTNSDELNMTACAIAKHLGYPKTIARVKDNRFLNRSRLDFARIFAVDFFIGPELLVAQDILKHLLSPGSLAIEHFAHGAVQLRTIAVPTKWNKPQTPLRELNLPKGLILGLIYRRGEDQLIFPHGDDTILPGDEVTLIGEAEVMTEAHKFFGLYQKSIESVVITGGSRTAINLAKLLEPRKIDVRLIEKDAAVCSFLARKLPKCTILHHDATDIEFLRSEKIGSSHTIIATTHHDELNLLIALLGKEAGCEEAIVMLNNTGFSPLLAKLGINFAVSPRLSAANHILSHIFSKAVSSLISLYDNRAEILEINVSSGSKLTGIPLSEIGPLLPNDFLIAMIQNRGRIMIANGNRIISPGDTVIVLTNPRYVPELEKLF